ncbi:MAG TPA: restriction endonuclease [Archangium sp.]|nr:restriction endonuclease [Archangium sp.]
MSSVKNEAQAEGTDILESDTLGLEELPGTTVMALVELAKKRSSGDCAVKLKFHLSNIDSTNDPVNIAYDYIEALCVGERLSKYCKKISSETKLLSYYQVYVVFSMWPLDFEGWARELIQLAIDFEFWREDLPEGCLSYDEFTMPEARVEIEENIFDGSSPICLPELADCFVANFIHGTLYYEEEESWNKKFPTWRYGFWKSALSRELGYDLYTSTDSQGVWIVLSDRDKAERLLSRYGGFSETGCKLYPAESLRLNDGSPILLSGRSSVYAPIQSIEGALECWRKHLQGKKRKPKSGKIQQPGSWHDLSWRMTEDGQAVVASRDDVQLVVFCGLGATLRPEQLQDILVQLESSADRLRQLVGLPLSPLCNWDLIDEERFEELCYDVLRRVGVFDEQTIRKHGKTRSRDGGRDIEIWTRSRLGKPGVKWIFQCKYLSNSRSLGAGRVDMSDVVEQYGAGGFGVMTNSVIDSTLYDKMDAIAARRGLEVKYWSGLELERFIAPRQDLLRRYF